MNWTEGWHFCKADARLGHDDGRLIVVGETLTVEGPPVLCGWGLHASPDVMNALGWSPDQSRLCRVRLSGEIIYDIDQAVATERTCLTMLSERETAVLLRRWAVWCARQVEHLLTDPRSRRAIDVAEAWCDGTATDEDLANAEEFAWEAAWEAAKDAARDAAWDAARAATDVARGPAVAARNAAWEAAWATGDVRDVRDAQRQQLETTCLEAIGAAPARGGGRR